MMTDSLPGLLGCAPGVVLIGCLIIFGRDRLRNFGRGLGKGLKEFKKATARVWEEMSDNTLDESDKPDQAMNLNLIVWIAQGFGVGRIPFAPGTFGSVVGLFWFALLLWPGSLWCFVGGTVVGILLSVWFCGAAEKALNQTDPSSVVLDEIAATPLCFAVWVGSYLSEHAAMPPPDFFFSRGHWPLALWIFATFRLFDVVKPWPVRQSQKLPGGWGVTVDDVLAALYVNAFVPFVLLFTAAR